ncbi:MAG: carbon starvation protein A [Phycisphaerales bacterium]
MDALVLAGLVGLALITAYHTYGRWLSRRVFQLREDAATPAVLYDDNRDYCPTKRSVVFGHHFTSIAGTGPIVGPAIAVMWGWVPAIIWVVVGSIFIGAVHDLGSLVVSLRNKGRSVGDIAGDLLGPRVRLIFLGVLVLGLWIVLAIFGLVVAAVLRQYPQAIFPVVVQVPLALVIGLVLHRKGRSILLPSIVALVAMYASVVWGDWGPLHAFNETLAAQPRWVWVVGLLAYSYIASVLPVWVLLQPRDYINSLQLISALGLLVLGLVGAATLGGVAPAIDAAPDAQQIAERIPLEIVAPTVEWSPAGAPPMIPILFITIACGAISGFHCLVSSGTTSKQVQRETDAKLIGYGSMLTEGFLATLVIVSCVAGIGLGVTRGFDLNAAMYRSSHSASLFGSWAMLSDSVHVAEDREVIFTVISDSRYRRSFDSVLSSSVVRKDWRENPSQPDELILTYSGTPRIFSWSYGVLGFVDPPLREGEDALLWHVVDEGRVRVRPDGESYDLTGRLAFAKQYENWSAAGALGATVGAFVEGAANLIESIGIPEAVAVALMGVLVASFAGTTMDTACRLQRYVIQELARTFLPRPEPNACHGCGYTLRGLRSDTPCPECGHENAWRLDFGGHPEELDAPALEHDLIERRASVWNPFRWLATRHGATTAAVVSAALLAAIPAPGQSWTFANAGAGGLLLWPLFGATNQLLGGLAFVVIGAWLIATRRPVWFMVLPALLMLALPAWAMAWQAFVGNANAPSWLTKGDWALVVVAAITLALEAWLVAEVALRLVQGRVRAGAFTDAP